MIKNMMLLLVILLMLSAIGCSSEMSETLSSEESSASYSEELEASSTEESDPFALEAPAAWLDAYKAFVSEWAFLHDIAPLSDENTVWSYSMRDLNSNGIPELLITQCDKRNGLNAVLTVYSYDGNIHKIGEYKNKKGSFISGFRISNDPMFPGLFELWYGGGEEHYGYLSLVDGKLVYEYLWHYDRSVDPPLQTMYSDNQQLIDESIRLYPLDDSTDNLLEIHPIDNDTLSEG